MDTDIQASSTALFQKGILIGLIPLALGILAIAFFLGVGLFGHSPVADIGLLSIPVIGLASLLYLIEAYGLMLPHIAAKTKFRMGLGLLCGLGLTYILTFISAICFLMYLDKQAYEHGLILWFIAYLVIGGMPLILALILKQKLKQQNV
ncbi:hypothetical protein EPA93_27100 [Ktedonosporobacter rubrisoli]|uniref:Uncharacterized protein n=1 Tax=Ktedonosporobacter rubrisoli TaxID=2509675 RepID=A0A4V0YZE6_KTERU|nr:hypothetical protein [Ktedonosporobacter rubrisoli]QBD79451.1 hypothetical protein EPA93_27100 [Ktedonosporobacter rubrisoli]